MAWPELLGYFYYLYQLSEEANTIEMVSQSTLAQYHNRSSKIYILHVSDINKQIK